MMKKKIGEFSLSNTFTSDESESDIFTKYMNPSKKTEQTNENIIKCFLRIRPIEKESKI